MDKTLRCSLLFFGLFVVWTGLVFKTQLWLPLDMASYESARAAGRAWPIFQFVTFWGEGTVIISLALILVMLLVDRIPFFNWLILALILPAGQALNHGLKLYFSRLRPVSFDPHYFLSTYSYPSGHAMGATVFYGFVALGLLHFVKSRASRLAVGILFAAWIVAICLSRVGLGVHWLTDVVGGALVGAAYLCVAWYVFTRGLRA